MFIGMQTVSSEVLLVIVLWTVATFVSIKKINFNIFDGFMFVCSLDSFLNQL